MADSAYSRPYGYADTTTGYSRYGTRTTTATGTGYKTRGTSSAEKTGGERKRLRPFLACCLFVSALCLIGASALAITIYDLVRDDEALNASEETTEFEFEDITRTVFTEEIDDKPIITRGSQTDRLTRPSTTTTTTTETPRTRKTTSSTSTTTTTTTTTKRTTRTTTTTKKPVPPPPLLCSVGYIASLSTMYPPDGTCDILIYTHVKVINNLVEGTEDARSFKVFRDHCGTYARTTCGLSFDIRFIFGEMFDHTRTRDLLAEWAGTARIHHYSIMNIYENKEAAEAYVQKAAPTIKLFRHLLGPDRTRRKIIIGVGFLTYPEGVEPFLYFAENSALPEVDIVVIITSILMFPIQLPCLAIPPNAWRTRSDRLLSMEKALPMAKPGFGLPDLTVAFSFQMGVMVYKMQKHYDAAPSAIYKDCSYKALSDYSQACDGREERLNSERIAIAVGDKGAPGQNFFFTFDTPGLMIDKAKLVMDSQPHRYNFTWFFFNVHLTDPAKRCLPDGPFQRLTRFRKFFHEEWRHRKP